MDHESAKDREGHEPRRARRRARFVRFALREFVLREFASLRAPSRLRGPNTPLPRLPLDDPDLLRCQPVERVDPLVDLRLQRADVGRRVCGLGGEDICDKITNH